MSRIATMLIVIAMMVTAISVSVVLAVQFGLPAVQAMALCAGLLLALLLVHLQMERRRDRAWMEARLAEIAAVAGDANADIDRITNWLTRLDQGLAQRIRNENEPLAAEIETMTHLVQRIAETLADVEQRTDRQIKDLAIKTENIAAPVEPRGLDRAAARGEAPASGALAQSERVATGFEREIEMAVRDERIEIHLQPIVTLPQRKVRYYEVLTRLNGSDGRLISAVEFLATAEQRRLIQRIDTFQVIRSFQILRRLTARNRDISLFVNISLESLSDTIFFREFTSFLAQNRTISDLVQFEFTQAAVKIMGPVETESLRAVADLGFRFSVDNVSDLRMDFRGLADLGFRTVKISADRLLGRGGVTFGDIHPADFSGHLQRQGIALIVDRIESEVQVLDLIDYDIRFAQGFLFSAPRQVRPEILRQASAIKQPAARAGGR